MLFIVLLTLGFIQPCSAGFGRTESGSRATALGGAFTAVAGDLWAVSFNAGGLSRLRQDEVSLFYSPSPFGLPELSTHAAAVGICTSAGVLALSLRKFGYGFYQEFTAAISCARSIPRAGFGLTVNYHSARIARYGSAGTIAIDAGIQVDASRRLAFGVCVKNANAAAIGASREPLPQVHAVGVSYAPADDIVLALDLRKESGFDAAARFGLEYWIAYPIALRGGFSDVTSAYTGGVGIRSGLLRIDYAFTAHQDLG